MHQILTQDTEQSPFMDPLGFKEIKLVNPIGNQPRILIGRTNAEAPVFWPPDAKS